MTKFPATTAPDIAGRISTAFGVVVSEATGAWMSVEFPFLDRCGERIRVFFREVTANDPLDKRTSGYVVSDDAETLSLVPDGTASSEIVRLTIDRCGVYEKKGELLCFADSENDLVEKVRSLVQCVLFLSCVSLGREMSVLKDRDDETHPDVVEIDDTVMTM